MGTLRSLLLSSIGARGEITDLVVICRLSLLQAGSRADSAHRTARADLE